MTHKLQVVIDGLVQGVGFRHATVQQARTLGLNGWVRNRNDGRVEAYFEGDKDTLKNMLEWCNEGPGMADVTNVEPRWDQGESEFNSFEIRF